MDVSEKVIAEARRRVLDVAKPTKIIIFGSAAAGRMNRDSDIDLLIIEESPDNPRRESVRIQNALRGMDYPFDVIVMADARFEETKDVIGGIVFPANKYGRVIYEESA